MNIVCAINKQYMIPFCTMATSLLHNTMSKNVNFYILNKDLTKVEMNFITKTISKINYLTKIHFIKVNVENLSSLLVKNTHLTEETLFRLFLGELLPKDIEKVLFLDSDLIIEKDILELYNTEIMDYSFAAVTDYNPDRWKILNLNSSLDYFNSGVMLINLNKTRNSDFLDKCLEFISQTRIELTYPDQDILNSVLNGEWFRLNNKWNVIRQWYMKDAYLYNFINEDDLEGVLNNPGIIHFTSPIKPWKLVCDHPKKDRYYHYLNMANLQTYKKNTNKLFLKKELVIFGSGLAGQKMFNLLQEAGFSVVNFLDNDENKVGNNLFGLEIIHPNKFQKKEQHFIIIASQYENEMAQQLNDLGFLLNRDYAIGLHGFCKLI